MNKKGFDEKRPNDGDEASSSSSSNNQHVTSFKQSLLKGITTRSSSCGDMSEINAKCTEQSEDGWSKVGNKRPLDSPEKPQSYKKQTTLNHYWLGNPTPTTPNRFESLTVEEPQITIPIVEKIPKPPPIFVDNVSNIQPLIKLLNEIVKDKFEIKVLNNSQVKIQPSSPEAYSIIVKQLQEKETEFYTYKPKNERSFRTILKNMHHSIDIDDVKNELFDLGHKVTNMWNIKHRETKMPISMFVVEFEQNSNNKQIFQIKSLLHSRIVFEPPRPKREIPQCANCQKYGHTKAYCHRKPKCIKCAGDHLSIDCARKTRSDSVKCVLCEGSHPANYKGCTVYKDLQKSKYPPLRERSAMPMRANAAQQNASYQAHTNQPSVSYAQVTKNGNDQNENPSQTATIVTELREMMTLMKQMMQQMTAMTNLLINLTSKSSLSMH